jgi:hypothetical protein
MLPRAHSRDGAVYLVLDPVRVVAFNTADGWMRDVHRGHRTRAAIYGDISGDNSGGATPQRHRPSTSRSRR